jgi:VanZ family protein
LSRLLQRWAPPVAWASLILIATSVPVPGTLASEAPIGADKLVHIALYGVLGWLTHRAVETVSARAAIRVFIVTSLLGAVDEWHQRFIPGRSPATADWVADTIGAATGILAFQTARRRRGSTT